ncbi:hypothetical protein [Tunturiibacter gelidoferens]|uniref:Uncharacterized protein n=1 Tax=Tunturiibacter lichenicola TaxID=2051959 RepID=A0A7Y9NR22_9BACT|nr:hypothetical protein [Edaphobacter lichenicola]NYF53964.1 hypothetical protein [Edaphobacter lichenicola]
MTTKNNVMAGLGLGVLVGLLLGLSVSNVVGAAVAALTALLATFFGLGSSSSEGRKFEIDVVRITSFSFACVFGVVLGVSARTHGWLSPSISEQVANWQRAGFKADDAQQIVKQMMVGEFASEVGSKTNVMPSQIGVTGLFDSATNWCVLLNPKRSNGSAELVDLARSSNKDLAKLLDATDSLSLDQRADVVRAAYEVKCQ